MVLSLEERSGKSVQWGAYRGAYPELDQRLLPWFSEQRSQGKIFPLMRTVFLLGKCRFKQEEIHLRFRLKFAMVSCDKLVYTICVNRWCNLVPRLFVSSRGKTGLAQYSRGDGEAFVQDLWHL